MRIRLIFVLLVGLLLVGQAFAFEAADLRVTAAKPGASVTVERVLDDSNVLLSVSDATKNPVLGLTTDDFAVTADGRTAKITSVKPIAESLEVPRHIVLVLDNSDSMRQRHAVEPLLAGVDELLKIVRPIDQVQVVVFSGGDRMDMGGRSLRVRIFASNSPLEVKNFVAEVYRDGITLTTRLYEAMLAGLELVRAIPGSEPRFMVVFSDGEDLNSAFKERDVISAAEGIGRFQAYGIDYMPGAEKDQFLTQFTEGHNGETWKATSETNLVPIFQSVASKMEYYYVVSYLFPTTGSLAAAPASLTVDEVKNFDAAAPFEGPAAAAAVVRRIDTNALILRPVVDTVYGIATWKITLANNDGALAVKVGEGMPEAAIEVPFKMENLAGLATGGDITASMELQDRKGQAVVLTAQPVTVNYLRTSGSLAATPTSLTIEEIKTIDSSPMLGYIYFAEGSSEIPDRYIRFAGSDEIKAFDEQRFRDTLEKYYQVLNIVGKRLIDHPEAQITLIGCNSNSGAEKGNRKLSIARAEAVKNYLQTVWSIAPERLQTEARNLPEIPSSSRLAEGKEENRRVEIRSDESAILAPVRSIYMTTRIDAAALTLQPVVKAAHGVTRWTVAAANSSGSLGNVSGDGEPPAQINFPLKTGNLNEMAAGGDITLKMTVEDRKGQELLMAAGPIKVNFIQTSQRMAEKQDFRVQEKYALILFDFDSDAISAGNQEIVDRITDRIEGLPQASAEVVGHTDNIGKESYNIKLSERRALAVNKLLGVAYGADPGERLRHRGVGPHEPLYDNATPEARAFNRTVTITLEYMTNQ